MDTKSKGKTPLLKYIENVYRLESSLYQQQNFIDRLEKELSTFPEHMPGHTVGCLGPMLGIIVGAVLMILPAALGVDFLWIIMVPLGGVIVIPAIGKGIVAMIEYGSGMDGYYEAKQKYYDGIEMREAINRELPVLQRKLEETHLLLQEYYDQDVVFPKYQNLVAISSFYEYLSSKRCRKLTGRDGAYDTFEREMRQDIIITQLDEIIDQLAQIKRNQFALYEAIQRSNRISERLYNEMVELVVSSEKANEVYRDGIDQLNNNLAVCNHIAELTRKEIEYRNFLDYNKSYLYQS